MVKFQPVALDRKFILHLPLFNSLNVVLHLIQKL